jgi:hypothetical protein
MVSIQVKDTVAIHLVIARTLLAILHIISKFAPEKCEPRYPLYKVEENGLP